jgi:pyruvate formate lyase activating enzyme
MAPGSQTNSIHTDPEERSLRIGGLRKTSLIDYPDKICCVVFLAGCNFHCPYCHNPDLARGMTDDAANIPADQIPSFLDSRRSLLDAVVISGGEPTLQPGLAMLCEKIKQLGYAVKLDTNGSRPRILQKLLGAGLIDYVAMDIKTDPAHYSPLIQTKGHPDRILESIRIIMDTAPAYEFRTTCVKPLINAAVIETIGRYPGGAALRIAAFPGHAHPAARIFP